MKQEEKPIPAIRYTFRSSRDGAVILKIATLLAITFALSSCGSNTKSESALPPSDQYDDVTYAHTNVEPTDTATFYLITSPCAIYVQPDTTWFRAQQKKVSEAEWNKKVDDALYYDGLVRDTLGTMNIPVYDEMLAKRYLKFNKQDGTTVVVDHTKIKEDEWGFLFFNGTDNPVIWTSTSFDEVLKNVYHK